MSDNHNLIPNDLNPFDLFRDWFDVSIKSEINDPNAMALSTISENNKPSSRIVLLKSYDNNGFVFYTNSNSKKGKSINNNSFVCLNFHWKSQKRQVRIEGNVKVINSDMADKYFNSRPRDSRIGAWASNQSSILLDRSELNNKFEEVKKKYLNQTIPRPSFWNGYLVEPNLIEFWQEMPHRLHDRVEFKKIKNEWKSVRLFP